MSPISVKRIPELDGLRGAAIGMVVLLHYFYFSPSESHQPSGFIRSAYVHFERLIALGWSGVDLFFVLSGFLIGGILLDVRSSPSYFKTFYLRRFYRIIPLYYVWILCYVGAAHLPLPASFEVAARSSRLWLLFAFVQNFGVVGYSAFARSWFEPTWSLAVEEQFYLVAPLIIRFFSRLWLYVLLGLAIACSPFLRLWVRYHIPARGFEPAYELMFCRADALAMGILAALLWRNPVFRSWLSGHASALYGLFGVFLLGVIGLGRYSPLYNSLWMESIGYTWLAGFYVLILLLALSVPSGPIARIARIDWLRELGRVSYCLYIIHTGIALLFQALLQSSVRHVEVWQSVLVNVPAALIAYLIARISWKYFENPLVIRGHEHRYLKQAQPSVDNVSADL